MTYSEAVKKHLEQVVSKISLPLIELVLKNLNIKVEKNGFNPNILQEKIEEMIIEEISIVKSSNSISTNIKQMVFEQYKMMDHVSGRTETFKHFSEKWEWWLHPLNMEFVASVITTVPDDRIYCAKISRYLNATAQWFHYLKNNPLHSRSLIGKGNYALFDFLCHCDFASFISFYKDFQHNMGSFDEKSRKRWVDQHYEYLPKTSRGFNKGEVILAYNWRLSHQGNLSKYWKFMRGKDSQKINSFWLSNRNDVGKSTKYEVIITKEVLNDILESLPPIHQLICLFLAQTGLRISDGISILLEDIKDLQFIQNGEEKGRFYIPNVVTGKRHKTIHSIFISKEFELLFEYYCQDVPKTIQNKFLYLAKTQKTYDPDIYDLLKYLKKEFNTHLKAAFNAIKGNHPHIKMYQKIRAHLMRKYFITQTDSIRKYLGDDYLRYIAGHQPLDTKFIIYNQNLRIARTNLKKFLDYLEPAITTGFCVPKIAELSKRKAKIENLFRYYFREYFETNYQADYCSLLEILLFFQEQTFVLSLLELAQLVRLMIREEYIEQFGEYYSFTSNVCVNGIKKEHIYTLYTIFLGKEKGIPSSTFKKQLREFIIFDSEGKETSFINKLREMRVLIAIDNLYFINNTNSLITP